ncbi:MAG TPA: hypothetical protein EYP10_07470, partial [Armatimonadetes bacterium]|nr:hypothetical protein [Armatimonadota bacterium]
MTTTVTSTTRSNASPTRITIIAYEPPLLYDVDYALRCEWLETNGLGGYASGTIIGANARRYHALLVTAMRPPTQRMTLLSKVEEVVEFENHRYELATNLYHTNVVHPHGYRNLRQFKLDLFPSFTFALGEMQLIKTIVMPHGRNAVIIAYELNGDKPVSLSIRLFTNARSHHHLMQYDAKLTSKVQIDAHGNSLAIRMHPNAPTLHIAFTNGTFVESRDWYYKFHYPRESERGLDDSEDLFTPGYIQATIAPKQLWLLIASTEPVTVREAHQWWMRERERRLMLLASLPSVEIERALVELCAHLRIDGRRLNEQLVRALLTVLLPRLWLSSDAFIACREPAGAYTIIAGYPWFTDWGRDAFIALPGLTLVTRRFAMARSIISTYMEHIQNGMVPNFFPENGSPPAFNA